MEVIISKHILKMPSPICRKFLHLPLILSSTDSVTYSSFTYKCFCFVICAFIEAEIWIIIMTPQPTFSNCVKEYRQPPITPFLSIEDTITVVRIEFVLFLLY